MQHQSRCLVAAEKLILKISAERKEFFEDLKMPVCRLLILKPFPTASFIKSAFCYADINFSAIAIRKGRNYLGQLGWGNGYRLYIRELAFFDSHYAGRLCRS